MDAEPRRAAGISHIMEIVALCVASFLLGALTRRRLAVLAAALVGAGAFIPGILEVLDPDYLGDTRPGFLLILAAILAAGLAVCAAAGILTGRSLARQRGRRRRYRA